MRSAGVDLLCVSPSDDLLYILGYSPRADERPCFLFATADDALFLVPELNASQARAHLDLPFLTYSDAEGPGAVLAQVRDRVGARGRVCAGETMRADFLLLLQARWQGSEFVPGSEVVAPVRMIKCAAEVDALRRSAATADVAMDAAFAACRPGVTEEAVARAVAEAFALQGVSEAGLAIVGGGPNSAYPHHHSGSRELVGQEPVLVDLIGRLDGYASDITRMAYLGEPSARYREVHTVVEMAVRAAMDAVLPGRPIADVDRAARSVIEEAGFGAQFTHRTGHGIGISGHEAPSVTHTDESPLQEGMTFSIEPGIYLEGEFGVRLEEIVVVAASGAERLGNLPREVRVLPA